MKAMSKSSTTRRKGLTATSFIALPDAEKERIYQEIDSKAPGQLWAESKPLTARQQAQWNKVKKNLGGRPKLGKDGTAIISVTVEKGLLKQAEAYAKSHGMNRSELVTTGLKLAIGTKPDKGRSPGQPAGHRRAAG
jgi:hypothetical protein